MNSYAIYIGQVFKCVVLARSEQDALSEYAFIDNVTAMRVYIS